MMPALAPSAIPSPDWSGFVIPLPWGQLTIYAYALCILLGIVAALWLTQIRWKRRGAPEGSLWDIAIWAIPFGIVGGRLYHVFTSPDSYFGPGGDPSRILRIWEGGLGIWGAVLLGVVGAWIGCRRAGVKLSALLDAAAPGLLLAQAIGRWGNYFNQELFGAPTTLPWGLQIDATNPNFPAGYPADTLFHPTFLYESLWNLVGVLLLLALDKRFRFRLGRLFALYVIYYTLGRVWIEALRIDDAQQLMFFGLSARLNVWTSVLVFIAALLVFIALSIYARRVPHTEQDQVMLPGQEDLPAPNADVQNADNLSQDADQVSAHANLAGSLPEAQTNADPEVREHEGDAQRP
ncbi:prolipoprotein diacylglyceryl transferase [Acaricomes phytoseiuli]|uniref:prolipoprotein diacylglyceryl transferase n=1 Tax=Acaricomes phytoseiuli TaxID=291968 RepID=UPI0005BDA54E|nr:prolipoprotein diacylglyceryl transferase [Acaricomes phytoseiuli]